MLSGLLRFDRCRDKHNHNDVQHNKVLAYYFVYLAIFIAYAVGTFLLGVEEITVDSIK